MNLYDPNLDPAGMQASEKLDGINARWDGQTLWTRDGKRIDAPAWFTEGLPDVALCGELWAGRGRFEQVLSIYASGAADPRWQELRYMVFDAPSVDLSLGEYADHVEREAVRDRQHLQQMLDRVIGLGGEGLVLRSMGVDCKHKPVNDDDAEVISHVPGKGKHAGRCGAIRVRDRAGREFKIGNGLSDAVRSRPPRVGAVVVFAFHGRTHKGTPRFPSFLHVRAEASLQIDAA